LRFGTAATATLAAGLLLTASAGAQTPPPRIGVILKGLDNPFFVAMYEGARGEAGRRHVLATFRAATNTTDTRGQTSRARGLARDRRNDCYVVNPITPTNLVSAFRHVGRPVVNVDSPLDPGAARRARIRISSFIGTDDRAAGELAARAMTSKLHRGDVALLNGFRDSVNSLRRLSGFTRGIVGTRLRIVARGDADYDRGKAQLAARRIIRRHPEIKGFFAANDVMALGVVDAVRAAGRHGTIEVVGVDAIPPALDAVRAGDLTGTVAQYPYVMGKLAIEACIAAAAGKSLPTRVKSPVVLVTKSNVAAIDRAFPLPPHAYSDPFARLLGSRR
jgi:ABC-type sugar transport system substrate-binding protein